MTAGPTLIFETVHGSHAYGLAREGSDLDLKGVVVGPREWYFGPRAGPEQLELSADHTRYEIRKLFRLLTANNPTLIEILWTDPAQHRTVTPAGERLLAARERFLSRRVRDTFGRYAMAQLRRIRTHRRWLLEPPKEEPTRADFGLSETAVVPKEQIGAAEALLDSRRMAESELAPNFLDLLAREKRYRAARREWKQYRQWLANRNPARAELEARFGYDTKHAMHLVRLQRMAIEILERGEVRVRRPDAEELLAIRDGALSYDELVEQAETLTQRIDEATARSVLPEEPDEDALSALCVEIVEEVLR